MEFGKQFDRLLDAYRKADGSRWQLKEIEDATNGFVKGGYLTNLKKGRIGQPGFDRLRAVAHVMDFPVQRWFDEPERWDAKEERSAAERGSLATRLNALFAAVTNPRTGNEYTDREVADLSFGRLTEDQVRRAREGELEDLKGAQYLALSEVFGVDTRYWYADPGFALDQDTIEALRDERNALILNKMSQRSPEEKDILLNLLDQIDLLRAVQPEQGEQTQGEQTTEGG